MKIQRNEKEVDIKRKFALIITLLLVLVAGCVSPGAQVDLVKQAGLDQTIRLEILEVDLSGQLPVTQSRLVLDDSTQIDQIITALSGPLELQTAQRCPSRYLLQFTLADGSIQEFGYQCQGADEPFLHGEQSFMQAKMAKSTKNFDQIFRSLVDKP